MGNIHASRRTPMPAIDLAALSAVLSGEEMALARAIVNPTTGCLRASRPAQGGPAACLWRMVAFMISPDPRHQCMPSTAILDLPGDDYPSRRRLAVELHALADRIVGTVPPEEWHGVIRWGQVFGRIGRPRIRDNGTIVYR